MGGRRAGAHHVHWEEAGACHGCELSGARSEAACRLGIGVGGRGSRGSSGRRGSPLPAIARRSGRCSVRAASSRVTVVRRVKNLLQGGVMSEGVREGVPVAEEGREVCDGQEEDDGRRGGSGVGVAAGTALVHQ